MHQAYAHRPSGAADALVAVAGGRLWTDGTADRPPGGPVLDAIGHPSRPIVVLVEPDPHAAATACRVRVSPLGDPETGTVVHRADGALRLIGWWDDDVVALAHGARQQPRPGDVLLVSLTGRPTAETAPAAVAAVDHDGAGRRVLTTVGPRPSQWNGHRGGGAGRILVHEADGSVRVLPGTGNAADAVVLDGRVFWLDDLDGAAEVYSLDLERPEGPPVRHSRFGGAGAASLRRSHDRLVLGVLGLVSTLRPGADPRHDVRSPVPQVGPTTSDTPSAPGAGGTSRPDRVVARADGALALLVGGAVRVLTDGDARDVTPAPGAWIVDVAWHESGDLLCLEHRDDTAVVVRRTGAGSVDRPAVRGPGAVAADCLVHAGGLTVVSGEATGVLVLEGQGPARALDERPVHRRSRPAVSPDGRTVAWTQEEDLQGGRLVVHDVETGRRSVLAAAGLHLHGPVFAASGDLHVLVRPVSDLAGTAAPMEPGRVLRIAGTRILEDVRRGRVEVAEAAAGPLHELALVDGDPWALGPGGRWSAVGGCGRGPEPAGVLVRGSTVPAAVLPDGKVSVMGAGDWAAGRAPAPATAPPPASAVAEAVRLGRHAARSVGTSRASGDDAGEALLAAVGRARTREDVAALLEHAAGAVGASHAAVLHDEAPVPGLADRAGRRAVDVLGDVARILVLEDVSVRGWTAVQGLLRGWRDDEPLVLDLRFNEGGQFADAIAARLTAFLMRSATAADATRESPLLVGPSCVAVLVSEYTGSGGEHLAAALRPLPGVTLLGRRTAGAGTGFHRTRPIGAGLRLTLPQYRLGGHGRDGIENRGVTPHVQVPADHRSAETFDDALLGAVADHVARAGTGRLALTGGGIR